MACHIPKLKLPFNDSESPPSRENSWKIDSHLKVKADF